MKATLLKHFFTKNSTKVFIRQTPFVRLFIYASIFINLLLPFYNYETNSFGWWDDSLNIDFDSDSDAKTNLETMNSSQSYYYIKHGKFSVSLQELPLPIKTETKFYSYRILAPMVPVQTLNETGESASSPKNVMMIAQAKYPRLNSYIGMVTTIKEQATQKARPISAICEIDSHTPLPSTMPILVNREIQCPEGSTTLGDDTANVLSPTF